MQDQVIKIGKWEFDEEVTKVFDNMLSRSIPQYSQMRKLCFFIGTNYVKDNTNIIDLGCSRGNAIEPFVNLYRERCKYRLFDVSKPMLSACKEKYKKQIYDKCNIYIDNYDITKMPICGIYNSNGEKTSLVLSVLTLQFTPIEYRQSILKSIYNTLDYGGAFIFVEKVLGNTCEIDNMLVKEYYDGKKEMQYTEEQIQSKKKSLEGVLVPVTDEWNKDLLKNAGFSKIDCFWRYLNFAGYIAIK